MSSQALGATACRLSSQKTPSFAASFVTQYQRSFASSPSSANRIATERISSALPSFLAPRASHSRSGTGLPSRHSGVIPRSFRPSNSVPAQIRSFSATPQSQATVVTQNPRDDEDGNPMTIEISERAASVCSHFLFETFVCAKQQWCAWVWHGVGCYCVAFTWSRLKTRFEVIFFSSAHYYHIRP